VSDVRLPTEAFLKEAETIVQAAEDRGILLRMCGSVGVYRAIRENPLASRLYGLRNGTSASGVKFKDLDLAAREKDASALYRLFVRDLGFREDRETNALFGSFRNIFYHPDFQIDVFFDVLRFNHAIPIKNRLRAGVTLPNEDLFLGKVQIHGPPPKDLFDLAAFVTAIPLDGLDRDYLEEFFGDDWGLWYDADANLTAARDVVARLPAASGVSEAERTQVDARLAEYQRFLSQCPKTRRWEKRAVKGIRSLWYEPVDEVR
jgi:hypothetical protein